MLRLSRYTIVSDPTEEGHRILFHGLNGAIDLVTEDVVHGLKDFGDFYAAQGRLLNEQKLTKTRNLTNVKLTDSEISYLSERGYLTSISDEEEQKQVPIISSTLHEAASKHPSFLVIPTLDCNYRCTYCFERSVQNHLARPKENSEHILVSHERGNVTMTKKHVDAMYKAIPILKKKHNDDQQSGQIVLYGGEPLDARNEEIVRYIVEQGRERGFKFAAITNGHDIETFIDLFGSDGIQQVQISVDGPQPIHDKRRVHLGKESSYQKITRNIQSLVDRSDVLVQIRVHIDPTNLEQFQILLDDFSVRKWLESGNVLVYGNTVYEHSFDGIGSRMSLEEIDRALSKLSTSYKNVLLNAPSINVRAKLLPALLDGLQAPLQGNYCAANTGQYLFSPDGSLYSCWESVGKVDSRIGRYITDNNEEVEIYLFEERVKEWFSRHVGLITECTACPMALVCGGGCAQFAKYQNGHMIAPYCDSYDAIFRSALTRITEVFVKRLEDQIAGVQHSGLVHANYG